MPKNKEEPKLIKLPDEMRKRLEDLQIDIEQGEKAVQAMKDLGFETQTIEDKINWAKKAREILLERF